ncbi:MAG TPA: glycoside hydrolase family 3 N-terminal domain-containing protein, partial [Gemmatimonadales bacterium]|nr:glycoside hydrolase family 3 N-terminal domain-containing protein [Gemmatimonadales bacterium]
LACAKHWPGHGRTTADSHDGVPVVSADARLLREQDEAPFRAAIRAGVDGVMTAHVAFPALDPTEAPATFSAPILSRLRAVGFEGLIATDALVMGGALGGAGAAALTAIAAGCDLLCYPADVEGTVHALAHATGAGITAKIDAALRRYEAALAAATARHPGPAPADLTPDQVADRLLAPGPRRAEFRAPVARVALEIVDDDQGGAWPASPTTYLADALRQAGVATDGEPQGASRLLCAFAEPRASKGRAGFSAEHRARLAHLAPKADLVVLFGHPRLAKEIPGDRPLLVAWHRQKLMQEAVARWLVASR